MPATISSRELALSAYSRPIKIRIGLAVKFRPNVQSGLSVEIKAARHLQSMLEQLDIGDALWGFGISTGVHAAIDDEYRRLANAYDLSVEFRSFRISIPVAQLTALELAQVGSLVRDMAREIVRGAIAQQAPNYASRRSLSGKSPL